MRLAKEYLTTMGDGRTKEQIEAPALEFETTLGQEQMSRQRKTKFEAF